MKVELNHPKTDLEYLRAEITVLVASMNTKQVPLGEAEEWLRKQAFLQKVTEDLYKQLQPKVSDKRKKEGKKDKKSAKAAPVAK